MPFPFTFSLSVPGMSNPFTRPCPPPASPIRTPLSRKRAWEPAFASSSPSATTLASTSGYLETPAKRSADQFHEVEMFADTDMPPPAKRRRGLAGSIVSTALSAALIGTAVGLTVYRLWRDRGKEPPRLEEPHPHTQPPPPPYQQGNWTPDHQSPSTSQPQIAPSTPRRKRDRHSVHSAGKRSIAQRRTRARPPLHTQTSTTMTQFPPSQPEFTFSTEPAPVEDQMDWIGDKLSRLIEEGKRALSREVVVMSDSQEDEVDDGSGAWEEDGDAHAHSHSYTHTHSPSRASTLRRSAKRPRGIHPPSFAPIATTTTTQHASLPPSPSTSTSGFGFGFGFAPSSSAPQISSVWSRIQNDDTEIHGHGHALTPSASAGARFREDEGAWESPVLRESMERARVRFARGRCGGE